jgi:Flp pilus assembly pilin Flp
LLGHSAFGRLCRPIAGAEVEKEGIKMRNDDSIQGRDDFSWPADPPPASPGRGETHEFGAGLAEYALLLLLIALACIGALTAVAPSISGIYNQVAGLL